MSIHSRKRAFERYNIQLTKKGEQEILKKIRKNEHIVLYDSGQDPKHLKFCYVIHENVPLKVLYRRTNKGGVSQIITIYPFDVEEYNEICNKDYTDRINMSIKFLKSNGYIVYKRGENGKNNG